jgi:V8-like Glu-specific endopeptidase/subtilisin-like proprotein convertase family protein
MKNMIACLFFILGTISCRNEVFDKKMVIYGDNDLKDVNIFSSKKWDTQLESVALITEKSRLVGKESSYKFEVKKDPVGKVCQGELFEKVENLGHCTGFLVEPDLLATARHCIEVISGGCSELAIAFDVKSHFASEAPKSVPSKNIYYCKQVFYPSDESRDLALIRLDRSKGASRLDLSIESRWESIGDFTALGHPLGGVQKIAESGQFRSVEGEIVVAELDVFEGNSGSPVLAIDGNVLGMIVGGEADFEPDESNCLRVKRCKTGTCSGERIIVADSIRSLVERVDLLEQIERMPSILLHEEIIWVNADIPDFIDGEEPEILESTFAIDSNLVISKIDTELEIEHENFTDVEFKIFAPKGEELKLLSGDIGDFSQKRSYKFDSRNNIKLISLLGSSASGNWRFVISDQSMAQKGLVRYLKVMVTGA